MDLRQLEIKSDKRGSLAEAFHLPHDGQVFYIVGTPRQFRGNHYHLRKTESFVVIWGSAIIKAKDRDTNNVITVEVTGNKPIAVTIVPNHTHSIEATDEGYILIAWADELLNEEDPDTYPEEL